MVPVLDAQSMLPTIEFVLAVDAPIGCQLLLRRLT